MRQWIKLFEDQTSTSDAVFTNNFTGSHRGQINGSLEISVSGQIVGHVDYSIFGGDVAIKMIEVLPEFRRQGYGTLLMKELQRRNPDAELIRGGMTPYGAALRNSLPTRLVVDDNAARMQQELRRLKARELSYREIAARQNDDPNEANKRALDKIMGGWNDLHDAIYDLEQQLADIKAERRFLDI